MTKEAKAFARAQLNEYRQQVTGKLQAAKVFDADMLTEKERKEQEKAQEVVERYREAGRARRNSVMDELGKVRVKVQEALTLAMLKVEAGTVPVEQVLEGVQSAVRGGNAGD